MGSRESNSIRILQWNARSLSCAEDKIKIGELLNFIETSDQAPEILAIQETWNHLGKKLLTLPGYKNPVSFRREKGKKGGGVATFVKNGIDSKEINISHTNKKLEVAIVRVFGRNDVIDVVNIYAPPNVTATTDDYLEIYNKLGKKSIFLGDFNARHELWDAQYAGQSDKGRDVVDFINATDYVLLNTGCGTRINPETGTLTALDLTLISASLCKNCTWGVNDVTLGSDHLPVLTSINVPHNYETETPVQRWKLEKANWSLFKQQTKNINLSFDGSGVNQLNANFIAKILAASKNAIPKTQAKCNGKKTVPWWNEACSEAVKQKHKAYYKYRKYKTERFLQLFRRAREESKYILESVKKQAWEDFISRLTYKTDSKTVWNTVKRFSGKPFRPVDVLVVDGVRHHTAKEKAEILATHYKNVSSNMNLDPNFRTHKAEQEPFIEQEILENASAGQRQAYNNNFTFRELENALNKKKSTAPGADTVHYDMLKQLPASAKHQLLRLINKSWNDGALPDQWKESTIIPLLKPGKNAQDPQSYRPISLTSAICKIMETMVASRLTAYVENNKILAKEQSGFRRNRSTIDQITRLESAIRKAKLRRGTLTAIFLDLEKAFDLLWTKGVLHKLVRFGIQGKMLLWIENFLTGRKMNVRIGNDISSNKECENGSPQGSVLSPLLFNLLMNTLKEALQDLPVDLSMFADDGLVWKASRKPKRSLKILQQALQEIKTWTVDWGFKLSTAKTSCVVFNRRFSATRDLPKLTFDGNELEFAPWVKFLGMFFDCELTWNKHITELITRCQKDLNLLRLVSGTSYGADKKTLIMLYISLIRSKIDYGCQAYASAAPTHLNKLDTIQATALRIATGAYKGTHNISLEVECNMLPLQKRRDEMQLKYWARSSSLGKDLPINELTQPHTLYDRQERLHGKIPYAIKVQELVKKHGLENIKIEKKTFPTYFSVCSLTPGQELAKLVKKNETPAGTAKLIAENHIHKNYKNCIKIYTDGSKDAKNQKTGCAFTIPALKIEQKFKLNSHLTVYTAEMIALVQALKWINNNKPDRVVILTDSLSAVQSLGSGKSTTRQDVLDQALYQIHMALKGGIRLSIDWIPSHCAIDGNEIADKLAKEALIKGTELTYLPTPHELYPIIKASIRQEWAQDWKNHHGFRHDLDPDLSPKLTQYSDKRRLDRAFTRLRLGTNGLRGNNLFHSEADPLCPHCTNEIEDTEHYFVHCPAHDPARLSLKNTLQALGLSGEINPKALLSTKSIDIREAVFNYLKETGYDTVI